MPPASVSMDRRLLMAWPMYGCEPPERARYMPSCTASASSGSGTGVAAPSGARPQPGSWPIAAASAIRARPAGVACAEASADLQLAVARSVSAGISVTGSALSGKSRFFSVKTVSSFWFHCPTAPPRPPQKGTAASKASGWTCATPADTKPPIERPEAMAHRAGPTASSNRPSADAWLSTASAMRQPVTSRVVPPTA
ncbi:hypothetical protein [Streptomyces sp. FXJ7.023]|uniref:hypothetical protein n=1 Tax=Streptomyces sp. FXJ7.023 TaxID=579932 RepID=UPI0018F86736|nr:hypothetical protein [Streptomyces sp. FXJ7.023]